MDQQKRRMAHLKIIAAETAAQVAEARGLFNAYAATRPNDPALADFPEEIAALPGSYAPPEGALLVAYRADEPVGCVALRRLDAQTCEMKRLFVLPTARGCRLGRRLAEAILDAARTRGYRRMRLDSIPSMQAAQALYRSLGFYEISPYRNNPNPGTTYMEKLLV